MRISGGDGEKRLKSGCVLNVELTSLASESDVWYETKTNPEGYQGLGPKQL